MTTVILVRHGQSVGNLLGACCGQKDYPLTEQGHEQARMTGAYLKEHYNVDHIYASSLTRTMQTAAPTGEAFGLEVIPADAFKEMCGGILEGVSKKEIAENPEYYELHRAWNQSIDIAPEGGETKQQLKDRVLPFYDSLLEKHRGECIAIFSHWGPIYQIYKSWTEERPDLNLPTMAENPITNSSITVGRYDENGRLFDVPELGQNRHLGDRVTDSLKGLV